MELHRKIYCAAVTVIRSTVKKLIPVGNTTIQNRKVLGWQTELEKQVNELREDLNVVVVYIKREEIVT